MTLIFIKGVVKFNTLNGNREASRTAIQQYQFRGELSTFTIQGYDNHPYTIGNRLILETVGLSLRSMWPGRLHILADCIINNTLYAVQSFKSVITLLH